MEETDEQAGEFQRGWPLPAGASALLLLAVGQAVALFSLLLISHGFHRKRWVG